MRAPGRSWCWLAGLLWAAPAWPAQQEEGVCTAENECREGEEAAREDYAKRMWTDDRDYLIRDLLDKADEEIVTNPTKAEEMFADILKLNPESGRAKYALTKTYQVLMTRSNNSIETAELCQKAKSMLRQILTAEQVLESLVSASAHLLLKLAERECYESKLGVIEALKHMKKVAPDSRYHTVLCHDLFLEGLYEDAMEEIDEALSKNTTEFLLQILKVKLDFFS